MSAGRSCMVSGRSGPLQELPQGIQLVTHNGRPSERGVQLAGSHEFRGRFQRTLKLSTTKADLPSSVADHAPVQPVDGPLRVSQSLNRRRQDPMAAISPRIRPLRVMCSAGHVIGWPAPGACALRNCWSFRSWTAPTMKLMLSEARLPPSPRAFGKPSVRDS